MEEMKKLQGEGQWLQKGERKRQVKSVQNDLVDFNYFLL